MTGRSPATQKPCRVGRAFFVCIDWNKNSLLVTHHQQARPSDEGGKMISIHGRLGIYNLSVYSDGVGNLAIELE